jgi:hypothetical protein
LIAIVFIQSITASEPHKSPAILEYGFNSAIRKPFFCSDVFEPEFWFL